MARALRVTAAAVAAATAAVCLAGCGANDGSVLTAGASAQPTSAQLASAPSTAVPRAWVPQASVPPVSASVAAAAPVSSGATSPAVPGAKAGSATLPGGLVDVDTGQSIDAQPAPTWDSASRTAAVTAAETVMAAFARPDLPEDAWWAAVQPLLAVEAARDYAYVDPTSVPASEVTGPGTLVQDSSAHLAGVEVPTDVGPYLVLLSRADATAPWLAQRLTPPAEVG